MLGTPGIFFWEFNKSLPWPGVNLVPVVGLNVNCPLVVNLDDGIGGKMGLRPNDDATLGGGEWMDGVGAKLPCFDLDSAERMGGPLPCFDETVGVDLALLSGGSTSRRVSCSGLEAMKARCRAALDLVFTV